MSEAFAPGPWRRGGRDGRVIYRADGWAVGDCIVGHGHSDIAQMEANADLIAAAPDEHAALAGLVDDDLEYNGNCIVIRCASHTDALELVHAAREALAAARGQRREG